MESLLLSSNFEVDLDFLSAEHGCVRVSVRHPVVLPSEEGDVIIDSVMAPQRSTFSWKLEWAAGL